MNNERREVESFFYNKCSTLLGVPHIYKIPYSRITRWNNRSPGNGRFTGYGVIRRYSADQIHIAFTNPFPLCRIFTSEETLFAFLSIYSK